MHANWGEDRTIFVNTDGSSPEGGSLRNTPVMRDVNLRDIPAWRKAAADLGCAA